MTEAEIRKLAAQVLGDIAPEAEPGAISDDEDLREALDLDSMDFLNFVIGLNKASGADIPEADYPKLFTMTGVVAYLKPPFRPINERTMHVQNHTGADRHRASGES